MAEKLKGYGDWAFFAFNLNKTAFPTFMSEDFRAEKGMAVGLKDSDYRSIAARIIEIS